MRGENGGPESRVTEAQLDSLFARYRAAMPDPEPSDEFTRQVWRRIEGKRNFSFSFAKLARPLVTAAMAMSMLLAGITWLPSVRWRALSPLHYVEILDHDEQVSLLTGDSEPAIAPESEDFEKI